MGVPFDHIASEDDIRIKHSAISQLQRKNVWQHIERLVSRLRGTDMLELNSGIGEDAEMFAVDGFNMIATDITCELSQLTTNKSDHYSMSSAISSCYLDLDNLDENLFNKKFDLVFSNFSALNCIHPQSLKVLFKKLPALLKPGGHFIAVIKPKYCLLEMLGFLMKLQFQNVFSRSRAIRSKNPSDRHAKMWCYNPADILQHTKERFSVVAITPIGLLLPPLRFERIFSTKNWLLIFLFHIEKKINKLSFLSRFADNFMLHIQLKP